MKLVQRRIAMEIVLALVAEGRLSLEARRAVRVGAIHGAGMDKILGLVLGCLISPGTMIVSGC